MAKVIKPRMHTDRVNVVYLLVTDGNTPFRGHAYPCAGLQYTLAMNTPHNAVVYVPIGKTIGPKAPAGLEYHSPQKLMEYIQAHVEVSAKDLYVKCQLWESPDQGKGGKGTLIFDGYIVSTGMLYTSTGKSGMQAQFTCMGKAVKLQVQPLSSYIEVASADLMQILQTRTMITGTDAAESHQRLVMSSFINAKLGFQLQGKDITEIARDLETPGMGSFGSPAVRVDGLSIAGK